MRRARAVLVLPLVALAGCGSLSAAELPPKATPAPTTPTTETPAGQVFRTDVTRDNALTNGLPSDALQPKPDAPPRLRVKADGGETMLALDPRDRRVTATGATTGTVGAGVGPVEIATDGKGYAYVTDAVGDGVVVIRTQPTLAVTRRVGLPGGAPWGIAYDGERGRLWVTLTGTNELVELAAGSRPRELRRFPSVRAPRGVAIDADGTVIVTGDDVFQRVTPRG